MPRIARVVAVGYPHHVTQRGNYGNNVFINDKDRIKYLIWLQEYSSKYELSLLAYCLMSNHVHFICIPEKEDSLAKTFNATHMRYSRYFNEKMNVKGHLWQGRFYSCVLDETHLIAGVRYVERNPVRAGIVKFPWEWKWSSASFHIGEKTSSYIKMKNVFGYFGVTMNSDKWKEHIVSEENKQDLINIRKMTLTGRPLGSEEFVKQLEKTYGRKLIPLPRGRPFKNK